MLKRHTLLVNAMNCTAERIRSTATPFPFAASAAAFALISAIALLIMAAPATAIGVSMPFLENNVLQLAEGHSAQFTIILQNVEESEVAVRLDYASDGNVAGIIDYRQLYMLPAKSLGTKAMFNITAPQKAEIGDVYEVKFTVSPVQAQAGGAIGFVGGISRSFKVVIIRDPNKFYLNYYIAETGWLWGIVVLILAGYVAYGVYKRKKKGIWQR